MNYITRKGGATVTIMVPYDCNNHCPFCVNKDEYKDTSKFNLDLILKNIEVMDQITPECDFVLTGGEPLADLKKCQQILDTIPNTHKVFINTTLPVNIDKDTPIDLAMLRLSLFLNNNYRQGKITGINVSRHLYNFVKECPDKIFNMLAVPFRINCVLYGKFGVSQIQQYVERFKEFTTYIQFRKDYTITTVDNLYDPNDEILLNLKEAFEYIGPKGEYRMRNGYEFKDKDGFKVTYHRTLPYSKIPIIETMEGENINLSYIQNYVIYDIIIKQDGSIYDDWNEYGSLLDIDLYKKAIIEDYN